ncbi:MAG: chromate transporter, partial [Actinomycetota bacterium]|nr:chromate transporter [Actinomycetota bacterium]
VAIPSELTDDGGAVIDDAAASAPHTLPSARRTVKVLVVGAAVWWVPLLAIILWRGTSDTLGREALFFSSATVVTFGGAYAVLAYVNQAAVYRFGWLTPGGVASGLGLAESTPGPLIMVTEFVGFLAAYRFHGDLSPLVAGLIGACVTVWATFAPCFLWIFLGAPYVERLRGNRRLGAALGAITSAVVGVIASLALSFGINVLFATVTLRRPFGAVIPVPTPRSVIWFSLAVAVVSFAVVRSRKVSPVIVVLVCGAAGLIRAVTR